MNICHKLCLFPRVQFSAVSISYTYTQKSFSPVLGLTEKYSFLLLLLQCCFTSTETVRTSRDGERGSSTSTFTQLLISDNLVFDRLSLNRLCILAWHLKHRFKPAFAVCVWFVERFIRRSPIIHYQQFINDYLKRGGVCQCVCVG